MLKTFTSAAMVPLLVAGAGFPAASDSVGAKQVSRFVSVREFGAGGDWDYGNAVGSDDTAAFQRAVDHAASAGSRSNVLFVPAGNYRISATIRLPNWVRVVGDNGRNTQIHAGPGFTDPYMFHAANQRSSMFHSRLEELWIRVHNNEAVRAVIKADAWQENDGLARVVVTGFTMYAVEIEHGYGGAATLHLSDCEFFAGSRARPGSAGVYVHQISQVSSFLLRVDSTTIAGASAANPLGSGIVMENDTLVARALHFENTRHGVRLLNRANAVLDAVTGSFTKTAPAYLVTLDRAWSGLLTGRVLLPNGYEATIHDECSGATDLKGGLVEVRLPRGD